ncbi:hypothetical protein GOODEAATRI_022045, partial [Goodea atripinnis]
ESDSESSGSGPVDVSVLGCGSVAGDSDWDSDLSDSDPSRSSRISTAGLKAVGVGRSKRPPAESDWDMFRDTTEPEVLGELFTEYDIRNNGKSGKVTTSMAAAADAPMETHWQPVSDCGGTFTFPHLRNISEHQAVTLVNMQETLRCDSDQSSFMVLQLK